MSEPEFDIRKMSGDLERVIAAHIDTITTHCQLKGATRLDAALIRAYVSRRIGQHFSDVSKGYMMTAERVAEQEFPKTPVESKLFSVYRPLESGGKRAFYVQLRPVR